MNLFSQMIFISLILFSAATFVIVGVIHSDREEQMIALQNQIRSMTEDMDRLSDSNTNLRQMNDSLHQQIEDFERREAQLIDCGYPD